MKNLSIVSLLLKPIVKQRIAREMILVPKLKYENLLKTIEYNEVPVQPDTAYDDKKNPYTDELKHLGRYNEE